MSEPVIISFGGGKGGTGKSTLAVNIGTILAERGMTIGFLDADLGGANLHTMLGLKRPKKTLADFLADRASLSDIAEPTPIQNTWLVSGASDVLEVSNPKFAQKNRLIETLKSLPADILLVDLGAGTGANTTDFFAAFTIGVIVLDGLPTSVENAYGFLKNAVIRGLARLFPVGHMAHTHLLRFSDPLSNGGIATMSELTALISRSDPAAARIMHEWLLSRRWIVIVNMVRSKIDVDGATRFIEIVKKYLGILCVYSGYLVFDPSARDAVRAMRPLALSADERTRACFEALTDNILSLTHRN